MNTPTLPYTLSGAGRGLFLLATDVLSCSYLEMEHSTNYHASTLSSYQVISLSSDNITDQTQNITPPSCAAFNTLPTPGCHTTAMQLPTIIAHFTIDLWLKMRDVCNLQKK